jgi:hypothetical protein
MKIDGAEVRSITISVNTLSSALKGEGTASIEVLELIKKAMDENTPIYFLDENTGEKTRYNSD